MAVLFSCLVTTNKSLCAPAPGSQHFPSGAIPRIKRAGLWNVTKCHDRLPGEDSQHGHPFASGLEPPASADHPLPCLPGWTTAAHASFYSKDQDPWHDDHL